MTSNHPSQWRMIQNAFVNKRIPQAFLFVGPLHYCLADFALKITALLHCKALEKTEPCGQCPDCLMTQCMEHPDLHWIKPEKTGSAIKIEQIRELQQGAFLTPQRSSHKIIVMESAERLNSASSNALLKILEEPAENTHFILIAEQLATLLPTILSRCQLVHFSSEKDNSISNLLELASYYPEHSERAVLAKQADSLIAELLSLLDKKQNPCILASQWSQYDLNNLLWFLYLVYSQVLYLNINTLAIDSPSYEGLMTLKVRLSPLVIFEQIAKINNILKKLSHNINMNQLLVLEDLLFSLEHSMNSTQSG
ncbi:DNA polymerase III subunit delta' [Legionella sp. km772]|uniref:DNA polymerase III subunit delta' n=1 Tax=Legionella sp. km772 TaxID=2498111 RepID=UPI000F8F6DA2|nr:DNA polymerase III subunit delta' [Legionella sp. km772]RUR12142.1 DNA polymerase III subunit delta' [Legionella sp. km772]